jgi:hypothetical protein
MPVFFRTGLILILFTGLWGAMPVHAGPSAFSLLLPANVATVSTTVLLDWEDSTDSAGLPLTYTIYLSKDNDSFADDPIKEGISDSNRLLKKETDGIQDSTTYYWKVQAINKYAEVYETPVWKFTTDDTNSPPAWIGGYVKNANNKPIVNARIKVMIWNTSFDFTTDSKGYFLGELKPPGQMNPGVEEEIAIDIAAEGYHAISNSMKVIVGDVTNTDDFTLETAPIPGDVNGDREVNLKDAVLVLKILTGESPSGIQRESALNQDKTIGLPELIYIFRRILNSN